MKERRRYISILKAVSDSDNLLRIEEPNSDAEARMYAELVDGCFLDGSVTRYNSNDGELMVSVTGIRMTVRGRLFLDELQEMEASRTLWGMIKKSLPFMLGIFVGVSINLITDITRAILPKPNPSPQEVIQSEPQTNPQEHQE